MVANERVEASSDAGGNYHKHFYVCAMLLSGFVIGAKVVNDKIEGELASPSEVVRRESNSAKPDVIVHKADLDAIEAKQEATHPKKHKHHNFWNDIH
jgi:hypothetical protein